jgi:hypothetical protein
VFQDEVQEAFVSMPRSNAYFFKSRCSLLVSDAHTCRKDKFCVTVWRSTIAPSLSPFVDSAAASKTNTHPHQLRGNPLTFTPRVSSDVAIPQLQPIAEEK